jgi:hypothetical protein
MLASMLPAWLRTHVLRYLPDLATDSLAGFADVDAATHLDATVAAVVVTIWLLGMFGIAATALRRRNA